MLILALGGAGAWYYNTTQNKIETLTSYNATLTANVDRLEEVNKKNIVTIERMQADFERSREQQKKLQADFANIRQQNNQLKSRLGKHDIGALAAAKPALVERVVNAATKKVNRCFELLSDAPLTEKERSAKNGKAFNSECPWIYDDLIASGVLVNSSGSTSEDNN
jgi:FtsZ-binding cell division protein ZapB|tara:strand:- start:1651 stop:2148 length:498 start_codon:yes stop_codon:yes gene_type:complete